MHICNKLFAGSTAVVPIVSLWALAGHEVQHAVLRLSPTNPPSTASLCRASSSSRRRHPKGWLIDALAPSVSVKTDMAGGKIVSQLPVALSQWPAFVSNGLDPVELVLALASHVAAHPMSRARRSFLLGLLFLSVVAENAFNGGHFLRCESHVAQDVYWSYMVRGTHPKYSAPVVDKPKVATRPGSMRLLESTGS